jgi:hypothetical protein
MLRPASPRDPSTRSIRQTISTRFPGGPRAKHSAASFSVSPEDCLPNACPYANLMIDHDFRWMP